MKAKFDANLPIEGLFSQIQDAVYVDDLVGAPYTPLQIINAAYQLFFQSGTFIEDC